jgi:hypothetical protein
MLSIADIAIHYHISTHLLFFIPLSSTSFTRPCAQGGAYESTRSRRALRAPQSYGAFGRGTCREMLAVLAHSLRFRGGIPHPKSAAILRRGWTALAGGQGASRLPAGRRYLLPNADIAIHYHISTHLLFFIPLSSTPIRTAMRPRRGV